MAIFTAIGGLIAGAIGLGSATLFGVSVASMIGGALAFGAQLALSYLNRPKKRSYSAVQGQREYGARVPAWALYGTGKVSGHHIYYAKWGSGNRYNADVFILANGWCDGLEPEIYFYGKRHALVPRTIIDNEVAHYGVTGFDDLISIRFYDGRPGQGPDTKLVGDTAAIGQNWKATSVCAGMAYVVVERRYDGARFDKGQPDFEFVLRGLRLYDPRRDSTVAGGSGSHRINNPATWAFSKNPALQRLNYQLGLRGLISGRTLIGEGKTLGQLDLGSYFAAMNACDTLRAGKATYQASLIVTADDDHTEVLKEFDDAMAGYGMNRRGLSGVIAGAPQIPVFDLTAEDIDMQRPKTMRRRKSAFDLYNHISGQFTSSEANWNPESLKPIKVNLDVAADGRVRQTSNDFLQVTDPDIAQYLLQIRYRQNRKGGHATVPVSRRAGFRVQEGEWITYAGITWLVTNWACDEELRVTLTLAETGSDVYSSHGIEPGPIVIPPTPPINPSLLSTVQNFAVEAGMITGEDGYEQPVLRFTWSPPEDPTITRVRFQYQVEGSTDTPFEDAADDAEAGEFITSKSVMSGKIHVGRATIVTVPDRFKTWTGWATTATATGRMSVKTHLASIGEDIRATLERQREEMDDLRAQLRSLAEGTDEVAGRVSTDSHVAVRFRDAAAIALSQLTAAVEDVGGDLSAMASALTAVQAAVGNVSADGLRKIEVQAGAGDVVARLVDMVRATIGDVWVEAGTIVEVGFEDADPDKPFANHYVLASKFGIIDPNAGDAAVPLFATIEGKTYIDTAFIGHLTADQIDVASIMASDAFVENLRITDSLQLDPGVVVEGTIAAGTIAAYDDDSESEVLFPQSSILAPAWDKGLEINLTSQTGQPLQLFCYARILAQPSGVTPPFYQAAGVRIYVNSSLVHEEVRGGQQGDVPTVIPFSFSRLIPTSPSGAYKIEFYRMGSGVGGAGRPRVTAEMFATCNKA